jgi:hypothetical protein
MVSATEHTFRVRRRKKTTQGRSRKRALRAKGSTPSFPLKPEKDASAVKPAPAKK